LASQLSQCTSCAFLITLSCHALQPAVAFRIYDADDDGFVTRSDILRQLQQTNRRGLSPPQLEQIAGSTVTAFDADGDGLLSYPEFRALLSASSTERNKALNF
jgi:serine/threonine-protein phosphatase 2B regulatory subunit